MFLDYHKELESPTSFWFWSYLCAVSAVVKDNIWFDKQLYKLYPNIYVMLHADSALKKGAPVAAAKQMVRAVNNTNIISGRSSIQGILKDMGTNETAPGGLIKNKAKAFICSSELSSSIVEDKAATTILTDLYDRHWNPGDWKSLLKMEQFSLKDPIITMLTATNEAHSEEFFVKQDIQGGFFGRTFIIYETRSANINSLMFGLRHKIDYEELAKPLKSLALLKEEFRMNDEIRNYFNDWYIEFRGLIDNADNQDRTGTLGRFDDTVQKVAMLINLARGRGLDMELESAKEAVQVCQRLVGNVRKMIMGKGKAQFAQQKGVIIRELVERTAHMMSRMQLNRKFYLHASDSEWDEIMRQLEVAGIIRVESVGNQIIYVMPENQYEIWRKHFEGKS